MAYYRQRGGITGQATDLLKDVAITGLGFTASGYAGRIVEDKIKAGVLPTSSTMDKVLAWGANNAPKAGIYVLSKMVGADILQDIGRAAAGSIAFDSVTRLASQGVNPYNITFKGYRIMDNSTEQKLMQENQLLRTELNKALAIPARYVRDARQQKYGSMPFANPIQQERQRKYGAMPFDQNPAITERQRKYGAATEIPAGYQDRPDYGIVAEIPNARVADRLPDFGSMPTSPAVAERQRHFGAMPDASIYDRPVTAWTPNPSVNRRQYGFAASPDDSNMFGMQ